MILLSASKVWLLVQRDGSIWSFLTRTNNHLSLHRHPEMSHVVVEETLLILQERQYYFLLELVDAVPRWMFSVPDLLLRLKKRIFIWEILLPSHWVFFSRFPMRPSSPTPQDLRPVRHPFKFSPRTMRIRGTIQVTEPSGIIGPLHGCPKRLS